MLQNIRANLQGTVAKVIIGLICVPFVLVGVESLLGSSGSSQVAEVNGQKISAQELNEAVFLRKRQLISQMGQNVNPAMLEDDKLKKPALDSLVQRKLLIQAAEAADMAVSPSQLNQAIINNPQFQQNGEFSNSLFTQVLASAGFNPELFSRLFNADMLVGQLTGGIVDTGFITSAEVVVNSKFTQQKRDVRYLSLPLSAVKDKVVVEDAELQTFYDENSSLYQSQEMVRLKYLELKRADFFEDVSEDELKDAYDSEIANLGGEDTREVAHILLNVDADQDVETAMSIADDIKNQLSNGADFADLAKKYSDDFGSKESGGVLGQLDADIFPEEFVAAASQLTEGAISEPVVTDSGLHLIKVVSISAADVPSFEERKDALALDIKQAKADPLFWQAVDDLKDASFNAIDLDDPAEALSLVIQKSDFITRNGGQGVLANPQVVQMAFSDALINEKLNSDVIELADDHVLVLRISEHKPQELLAFDVVKDQVKEAVVNAKADALLKDSVASLLLQVQQGAEFEKLAKTYGYEWQLLLSATRNGEGDRQILNKAFSLPDPGPDHRAIDSLKLSGGDYAILAIDNVVDGDTASMSDAEVQGISAYMGRAKSAELFQAIKKQLEGEASIEIL